MFTLIVENLRSFKGRHEIEIKPLTLLVGENSSGKSTLLAALAAVTDEGFPYRMVLNRPPFSLGNFPTIATRRIGKAVQSEFFGLGYKLISPNGNTTEVLCKFINIDSAASLKYVHAKRGSIRISLEYAKKNLVDIALFDTSGKSERLVYRFSDTALKRFPPQGYPLNHLLNYIAREIIQRLKKIGIPQKVDDSLKYFRRFPIRPPSSFALAPVSNKPKRTYDEIVEEFSPHGEHVPYLLDDILRSSKLRKMLFLFGKESGLFSRLNINTLGKGRGDPMQVEVLYAGGRRSNLVDVGYGVSQALPVIAESIKRRDQRSFLLVQQPEVHLHPKAQAALGSFFSQMVLDHSLQYVIETHSDAIMDRVRLEISKCPELLSKASLVFVQKKMIYSVISPIELDETGNIIKAPPGYRSFFLREQLELLGR